MIQGVAVLKSTITCGGLAGTKSQAIIGILEFCDERQGGKGELSLEYLRQLSDMEIIETMMRFAGVGVKTVTCVMLLCMGRDFFAVDTYVSLVHSYSLRLTPLHRHVFRISKSLGWLPSGVSDKDIAFNHLDDRIPPEYKFGLHVAFVEHGRGCVKCSANGNVTMCFVDTCNINHLVSRSSGGKSAGKGKAKGVSKGKGMSEKDLVEPTESDFLVPRQRTPSSVASPEEKPKPITSPTRVYKVLDIGSPALKTEHLVRDEKTPGGRARSSRKRATHDLGAEGQSPSSGKVPRLKTEKE
jgi:endonuclease III